MIASTSDDLMVELAKRDSLPLLRAQRKVKVDGIAADKRDRQSLIDVGQADRGGQLERVSDALSKVRKQVDAWAPGIPIARRRGYGGCFCLVGR